jgi:hypothetical protein
MLDKLLSFIARVWYAFGTFIAGVFGFILPLPLFTGLGVLLWQIGHRLKSGGWPSVPVSDVLPYFGIHSQDVPWPDLGAQKFVNVFLDVPLRFVSFIIFWFLSGDWLRKNLYNVLWPPKHRS